MISAIIVGYICFRAQSEIASGYVDPTVKPISVEGCDYTWDNETYFATAKPRLASTEPASTSGNQLAYLWYCPFGFILTLIISISLSMFIDPPVRKQKIDLSTLAPIVRRFYQNVNDCEVEMNEIEKIEVKDKADFITEEEEPLNCENNNNDEVNKKSEIET